MEFESTEFQQEVTTLTLVRKAPLPGQRRLVSLIPTAIETSDAYRGYEVLEEEEVVSTVESCYPTSEWRLANASDLEGQSA